MVVILPLFYIHEYTTGLHSFASDPVSGTSIFRTIIVCYVADGIQTHNLPLTCNLLYHYITLSLVSILHFLSPHIILN